MPRYTFICLSTKHPPGAARQFEQWINHKEGKRIDQSTCMVCGTTARRDLTADLQTVNVNGLTPIAVSDSKFSLNKELGFSFGKFKKNKDGSFDKNHAVFRDTGELNKFMNGANDLGPPKLDQSTGEILRRHDGSVVRDGAKLFKYGPNATPSRDGVRSQRPAVPDAWTTEERVKDGIGGVKFD